MVRNKNKNKGRKQVQLTDSMPIKVEDQPRHPTVFSLNAVVVKKEGESRDATQSKMGEKYIKKEDQQHIKKENRRHIKQEDAQHTKQKDRQYIKQEDGQDIKQEDGQNIKKEDQRHRAESFRAFYPASHCDLIKGQKDIIYTPISTTYPSPNSGTFKREYDDLLSGSSTTDPATKKNRLHHGFPSCTFDSDDVNTAMKENRLHHGSVSERFDSYDTDSMWKENQLYHEISYSKIHSHDTDLMKKENQLHNQSQAQPTSVRQAHVHRPPVLPRGWKPPADPEPDRGATYTIPNYKDILLWPASLKHYIARSFEDILPEEWDPTYKELHAIILEAVKDDVHLCVDWDKMPLPNVIRHDIRVAELRKLRNEIEELDELQRIEEEERERVWERRRMEREKMCTPKEENAGTHSAPNTAIKREDFESGLEKKQNGQSGHGGRRQIYRGQEAVKDEIYYSDDDDRLSRTCSRLSDNSELGYTHALHRMDASNHYEFAAMSGLDLKATKCPSTDNSLWDMEQLRPSDSISQVGSRNGCEDLHDIASTSRRRETFTVTNNEQTLGMKIVYTPDDSLVSSIAPGECVTVSSTLSSNHDSDGGVPLQHNDIRSTGYSSNDGAYAGRNSHSACIKTQGSTDAQGPVHARGRGQNPQQMGSGRGSSQAGSQSNSAWCSYTARDVARSNAHIARRQPSKTPFTNVTKMETIDPIEDDCDDVL
ncbi:hypothetical protein DFP73DRAFT_592118 [Morchella snyderi]|nr:hypothetical protein DFP73DRAFT_592118 [Morchella snyderi]